MLETVINIAIQDTDVEERVGQILPYLRNLLPGADQLDQLTVDVRDFVPSHLRREDNGTLLQFVRHGNY